MKKESLCFGIDIEKQRGYRDIDGRWRQRRDRSGDREGGTERLINMEWESVCVCGGEIKRQRRRDGGTYRYIWRGERGKNISYNRCIDFSVDSDF